MVNCTCTYGFISYDNHNKVKMLMLMVTSKYNEKNTKVNISSHVHSE